MTQPVRESKKCPKCGQDSYVNLPKIGWFCYLCNWAERMDKEKEVEDET